MNAREDLTVTGRNGGQLPGSFTMEIVDVGDIVVTDTTKVLGDPFDTGFDAEVILKFRA